MAPEVIVLDPVEVATGRTQLDVSAYAKAEGIDWGDAAIEAFMADRERGSAPVDFRVPNRQIVLPMNVKPVGAVSFVTARRNLQAKVARIQSEGGWLSRTTASGKLFLDVVNATLHFGGDWLQTRGYDINAELRLEAIPDWYGPEVTLADHVETTNPELIFTESNIPGDYPGRLRLVVDNDQGVNQMGLVWGVRCRHYSSAATAALRYNASTCTPLDAATVSGPAIAHSNLSTNWTSVLSTDQSGVSLTHTGTYRMWAKVTTSMVESFGPIEFRLLWDVGDFALPTENQPARVYRQSNFYDIDLGEVRLDRVPSGTHRWRGVVQARGPRGGEFVSIVNLWFVPVDEGYGVLRAPLSLEPGLNAYSARDEFNQTAGALAGKTLPAGGVWAGAGDTDDFVVEATGHTAQRTAISDSSSGNGRFALAGGTNYTAIVVQADIRGLSDRRSLLARYSSTASYLSAGFRSSSNWSIDVAGGSVTGWAGNYVTDPATFYTVRLWIDTAGNLALWIYLAGGSPGDPVLQTLHPDFATGGALATGRVGLYDAWTAATPQTRNYNNFAAWVPQQDAVLFANQSAELRTEGMFREDPTGSAFGPVSHVVGDLPRIPASGAEGRPVQFFVKQSRGDFGSLPDTGVDDLSARVSYRPSYLLTS